MEVTVRRARPAAVRGIRRLTHIYAAERRRRSSATIAVDPRCRAQKIGHRIVSELVTVARELGIRRVFVLTFETRFFASFGFVPIDGTPVTHAVYEELLRSYDEGVAEFLDLERVKPNTLGNTRMLLHL